jgi:Rrf2 family protein
MRISKKAEYALRALGVMALESRSWTIEEISQKENIPLKYLEQILLALKNAGLLGSKRGIHGGYTLLRPPAAITFEEIVRLLDGPLSPLACSNDLPSEPCSCPDRRTCPLRSIMRQLNAELVHAFAERSLEDMVRIARNTDPLAFEI